MPYRRLPNTDAARVRAIQAAVEKGAVGQPNESVISYDLFLRAKFFLVSFQNGITQCRTTYSKSVEKGANFVQMQKRAKMYISHFIQVLNMTIQRGEMKADVRNFYGLEGRKLPDLSTVDDILVWGKKLIDGDAKRVAAGGPIMQYPRMAIVKIEYDKFAAAARTNEFRLTNDKRSSEYMDSLRNQADEIILTLWNEIEAHFLDLDPDERRKTCSEYGISYVWRKSELEQKSNGTNYQ